MSEAKTKSCNLTEDEMWAVQQYHATQIINSGPNYDAPIERMAYINKRIKTFNEPETKAPEPQVVPAAPSAWGASA